MKKLLILTSFLITLGSFSVGYAGEQTIKLSVPGMNCASCPYMIETIISRVDGVIDVDAALEDRSATVKFEDSLTSVEVIKEATASIGYKSELFKEPEEDQS